MKKRETHYLKKLFMAVIMSTLLVSCGQENESGRKGINNPFGGFNYAGIASANGMNLPANWLQVVGNENPCRSTSGYNYGPGYQQNQTVGAGQRQRIVIPMPNFNVNAGAAYVGVTPEGDIGIVSNQNQGPVLEVYICVRPDVTGQGQVIRQPALNTSQRCPVSEITASDITLSTNSGYGDYLLKFAPIHIPGTDRFSSLCR